MSTVSPFTLYRWWRHSRGFGVHSPWAYSLIMEALRPHGTNYAYDMLNAAIGRRRRLARMVMRVLEHLRPGSVTVLGGSEWAYLVERAGCTGQGGEAVIVDRPEARVPESAETVIFTCLDTPEGRRAWQRLLDEAHAPAMAIDTHRALGILSRRQGLPRQTIHLRTLLPTQ